MKQPVSVQQSTVGKEAAPCNVCFPEERDDRPSASVYVITLQSNPARKSAMTVTYCKKHMLLACESFALARSLITGER